MSGSDIRNPQSKRDTEIAKRLSEEYCVSARDDLAQLDSNNDDFDDDMSKHISESDEHALKASRLRKFIEAKQERERTNKRREIERRAEEKRLANEAMMVKPGEGIINWRAIVEAKRRK